MKASTFFTDEQQAQILAAVKEAELSTSGEVRIHIETNCPEDVLVNDKKFAVIGDAGINAKVPAEFWNETKDLMASNFRQGRFTEGLTEAVILAGKQLKAHFPYAKDDKNELSDEISFDKIKEE